MRSRFLTFLVWLGFVAVSSGCSVHCVLEGTGIETPCGSVPVERLAIGDEVVTVNSEGERRIGHITAIHRGVVCSWRELRFAHSSDPLRVTDDHLIRTRHRWVRAGDLRPGASVDAANGEARITQVSARRGRATVYDLGVEPYNAYVASGVVVHNKTVIPFPTRTELAGRWIGFNAAETYWLDLNEDGSASLIIMHSGRHHRDPLRNVEVSNAFEAYTTDEWELDKYRIAGRFDPVGKDGVPVYVRCDVSTKLSIRLAVGNWPDRTAEVIHLLRPEEIRNRLETLQPPLPTSS